MAKASDLRFTGHEGNRSTYLQFELPPLEHAASDVYAQPELFDMGRPAGTLTGLDLFMNVVREIDSQYADSDVFDPQLLRQVAKF